MDGVILPVPVPADDIGIFLRSQEAPEIVALVGEDFVGMIVVLSSVPIGADYGSRADENSESGIAFGEGLFEPGHLLFSPYRFVRSVGHRVGAAKITAFHHPDLQVLSPANGSVSLPPVHGDLLHKNIQPLGKGEVPHLRGVH